MNQEHFNLQWPRENLYVSGFVHEIMNYRYHWHSSEYELNILLHGDQEFRVGNKSHLLEEDDVVLINPGSGHASFAQQANTRALVIHFSAAALKPYVIRGHTFHFPNCCSTVETKDNPSYNRIRFYAAQIYHNAQKRDPYALLAAKASLELLLATLCSMFHPQLVKKPADEDIQLQETIQHMINYIELHYNEKLSLEDLANYSQYNRTYVSTLFKKAVGINFYEYLTRVRFQKALIDLSTTSKNLTEVALDNGFADLKSFNTRFKEAINRSPAEYRSSLSPERIMDGEQRKYISPQDPLVKRKMAEYLKLPDTI
ncbi:MAG: AraC family transcriptional regulator [Lachnospiraceae bacterium]